MDANVLVTLSADGQSINVNAARLKPNKRLYLFKRVENANMRYWGMAMSFEQKESNLSITRNGNCIVNLISPSHGHVETQNDARFFANIVLEVVWKLGFRTRFLDMKDHLETTLTLQRFIWNPLTWLLPKRVLTSQPLNVSTTVS